MQVPLVRRMPDDSRPVTVDRCRSSATGPRVWSVPSDPMTTPRSLISSPRPPHLTQRMPGVEATVHDYRRTGALSPFAAESEAERHSVAVRPAVRIGEIHCGAMGKPSGINTFKSEGSWFIPSTKQAGRRQEVTRGGKREGQGQGGQPSCLSSYARCVCRRS